MKSTKTDAKQKSKSSLKEFRRFVATFILAKKWYFLSVILIALSVGMVIFLSSPVSIRTQIISQKWETLSFRSQETQNQPGIIQGTAQKISARFYIQGQGPEQKVSIQISSPNIKIFDITDYYQPPSVGYSSELGGYYLSLLNLVNGQTFNLTFNDGIDNLQDKLINSNSQINLELPEVKGSNADINSPSVLLIANGSLGLWWDLPIDCSFNILNWKDSYTNNFPSLNISSQCPDMTVNKFGLQLTKYLPDGGTKVFLVTNGMSLPGNEVINNQNKQYLLVLDRSDNYSSVEVTMVAGVSYLNLDTTYDPEKIKNGADYLSIFNPGYSYSISNSVGKIKLGSQTISTDEYSDVDMESKNGNFAIDIRGSTNNESSPFMIDSQLLANSLKINFDEMIKNRWSVFPTEIWSAIIGGFTTILGTFLGYLLGKGKKE